MTIKSAAFPLLLAGLGLSGQAFAACTGPSLNQQQLSTTLTGNTVCAMRGNDRWQELHQSGGAIIDYKRGPGHAIDPSKQTGSWSLGGTGSNRTVIYNYGAGGTYSYTVHDNGGGSYSFCTGGVELLVTVRSGAGPCP